MFPTIPNRKVHQFVNILNVNMPPPEIPLPYIIDEFNFLEILGEGNFGKVYKGINLNTNEEVAIKAIYKIDSKLLKSDLYRELWALQNIRCENIVKFIKCFETQYYIFIAMERCDTDLEKYLIKVKKVSFSNEEIRDILLQLNNAFRVMRQNKLIHRDLKLDNIMMKFVDKEKTKYILKLADFGQSRQINENENEVRTKFKGANIIQAPEMRTGIYNEKCDLWSIGIMIHHLYFGYLPQYNYDYYINIFNRIESSQHMDPNLRDLLKKLLIIDKEKRISWKDYFNHPFFAYNVDKYTKISDFNLDFNENYDENLYQCYIANYNNSHKKYLIKSYNISFIRLQCS